MKGAEELRDLAVRLAGCAWWQKIPREWSGDEQAAYTRAPVAEKAAYLEDLLHRKIDVSPLIAPPPDVSEFER